MRYNKRRKKIYNYNLSIYTIYLYVCVCVYLLVSVVPAVLVVAFNYIFLVYREFRVVLV
jgi:hypothetical protein